MVALLPKDEGQAEYYPMIPNYFDDYEKAFDYMNELIAIDKQQIFKQPKGEKPLRVSLGEMDIELWVISRTDELLTN